MGNHHFCFGILPVLITLLVFGTMLGFFTSPTFADDIAENEPYDLILEVKQDRKNLSNVLIGLEKNGKFYIPIEELAQIVQFNAKTDLQNGTAEGFFLSEKNAYRIDVKNKTYTIKGQTESFDESEAFVHMQKLGFGDIYVTPELLNKIWPLELELDTLSQALKIQTDKKLPYQLLNDRERLRNKRLEHKRLTSKNKTELGLPRIPNTYKTFSLPALDFSSITSLDNNAGGLGQSLNISGRQDLLKAEASYNFNFDKDPGDQARLQNANFLLERKAYDKGELPLGLQLVQLGDIRPRPSRLIDGSLRGRGLLFSTEPQKQLRDFDTIVIEGLAEPGWEIELYRGNELIGFQTVDSSGEYRFEDITLNYSTTSIRTVLYGPEGQVREEEQIFNIGESMLKPGKTIVEASVLDQNRDLINSNGQPKNQPEGAAANVRIKRGITSWLSTFATFTNTPTRKGDKRFATIGADFSFLGISGLTEIYRDLSGGMAYDLRAATNFAGFNINVRNSIFSDFESDEARYDGSARTSRTEFSISKPFQFVFGNLGLRFRAENEKYKSNPDRTEYDFSQTFSRKGFTLTHGNTTNLLNNSHLNTDGRVNATFRLNQKWQLRSFLNYDLYPIKEFRNIQAELRYRDRNKFTAAIDANRNLQEKTTRYGAQAGYDFETFRTALDVDWERNTGARAFLRASFSMAPFGKDGDYIYSSKNLSSRSALNGRVFLDRNYDGQYDADDRLLEDAKIDVGRRETGLSGSDGYAQLLGTAKNEYENLILDTDTLEDPYFVSGIAGYNAAMRAGQSLNVDFPVIATGVIDGFVTTNIEPLASVRMELLKGDKVLDNATTAYDGYYMFEYVEPGKYTIRIDPAYDQVNVPPREILVTSGNLFHYGVDFLIIEQAEEVPCEASDSDGRITQNCRDFPSPGWTIQSAHSIPGGAAPSGLPAISNLRIAEFPDYTRVVLDLSSPLAYELIKEKDDKEISLVISNTGWDLMKVWANQTPVLIDSFWAEELLDGRSRLVLQSINKLHVRKKEVKKPEELSGKYQIYLELTK